jgi:TPP-dependent pyruvate/acetoin dehydrogenase alpha subunit
MGPGVSCDEEAAETVGQERLRRFVREMQLVRRFFVREMQLVRRFEERCAREYAMGRISGFCHLYIGQEAVAVGAIISHQSPRKSFGL